MKLFRKVIFWSHLTAGVTASLVIFMMAATGVLLTYERQMIAAAEARLVTDASGARLTVDELAVLAQGRVGGGASVQIPSAPDAPVKFRMGRSQILVHPITGQTLLEGQTQTQKAFGVITEIHRWFALQGDARETGKTVTNVANLLFVFLAVSGVYLWLTPIFRWVVLQTKLFFNLKPPTGKARDYNWHHVFSIWMLIPIFVMATTAAVISYSWANRLVFAAFGEEPQSLRPPPVEVDAPPAGEIPVAAISLQERFDVSAAQHADWRTITVPAAAHLAAPTRFAIDLGNGAQSHRRYQAIISPNGEVLSGGKSNSNRSPGAKARIYIRFLHTGEVLGFWGQTLAGLGSLATLFLVWTGLALSYRRLLRPIFNKSRR